MKPRFAHNKIKISYKNWVLVLLVLLANFGFSGQLMACGIGEGYFGYYRFFEPAKRQLSQFHGFAIYFTKSNSWGGQEPELGDGPATDPGELMQANVQSWKYYFGGKISEDEIRQAVYHNKVGIHYIETIPGNKAIQTPLARRWQHAKYRDEITYLNYASRCEPFCTQTEGWDQQHNTGITTIHDMLAEGEKGYQETRIPFLKLRYAYQLVRIAQYNSMIDEAITYYEDYARPVIWASKEIGGWVAGNYGGCLRSKKRYPEAAYAFSRQYANSPSRRVQARWGWQIDNDRQWQQLMRRCKNDRERADNYALRALSFHAVPHEDMRMMQQLDPGREDLDLILVREINNLEKELLGSAKFGSFSYEERLSSPRYIPYAHARIAELDTLVTQGLRKNQAFDAQLWKFAHIYLLFLNGHFDAANEAMEQLTPSLSGEDRLRAQKMSLEMQLIAAPRITPHLEARLAASAIKFKDWDADMKNRFIDFRNDALFWKYMDQGDEMKASLVREPGALLSRFGVRISLLDSVIAFKAKPHKNALEEEMLDYLEHGTEKTSTWSYTANGLSDADLWELKGTNLIAQGKLDEAITALDHLGPNSTATFDADPFRPRIGLVDNDKNGWSNHSFDKHTFAQTLKKLTEGTSLDDGKNHMRYFAIGNAYFNTLSGQRAAMLKGAPMRSGWHFGYERVFLQKYNVDGHKGLFWPRNIDTKPAIAAYERAIASTHDPEIQALAYYMIARCERYTREWITAIETENAERKVKGRYGDAGDYHAYSQAYQRAYARYQPFEEQLPAFAILRDRYADTKMYDMLIHECPNFQMYCAQ